MLRDVVIHLHNEQPILADLLAEPTPADNCLVCTNLRTMSGKPPVFVERGDSTFVFPMIHIRFVEIRPAAVDAPEASRSQDQPESPVPPAPTRAGKGGRGTRNALSPAVELEAETDHGLEEGGATNTPLPLLRLGWARGDIGATPEEGVSGPEEAEWEPTDEDELLRRDREA